jgi:hypothetical protein
VGDVVAFYKRDCNSKIYYFKVQEVNEEYGVVKVKQMDVMVPDIYPNDLGNVAYYPDYSEPLYPETYTMHQTSCPWVLETNDAYYVLWSGLNANLVEDFWESGLSSPYGRDDDYDDPEYLKVLLSLKFPFIRKRLEAMKTDPKYSDYFDD